MSKKVTVTKTYIDYLKRQIETSKAELEKVKADRGVFRDFYVTLLKDNVRIAKDENSYFSSGQMIIRLSKLMNSVESWYW